MTTLIAARLPNGLYVCKGEVWKSLDDLDKHLQQFWTGDEMLVREASKQEIAYWLESIRNRTATIK